MSEEMLKQLPKVRKELKKQKNELEKQLKALPEKSSSREDLEEKQMLLSFTEEALTLAPEIAHGIKKVKEEDFKEFIQNYYKSLRLLIKYFFPEESTEIVDFIRRVVNASDPNEAAKDLLKALEEEDEDERKKKLEAFKAKYTDNSSNGSGGCSVLFWILIIIGGLLLVLGIIILIGYLRSSKEGEDDEGDFNCSESSVSSKGRYN
jgi:uncharacterized membrane protein